MLIKIGFNEIFISSNVLFLVPQTKRIAPINIWVEIPSNYVFLNEKECGEFLLKSNAEEGDVQRAKSFF